MIPDFGRGCCFCCPQVFAGAAVAVTGRAEAVFGSSGEAVAVAVGMGFSSVSSAESSRAGSAVFVTEGAAVATRMPGVAAGAGVFSSLPLPKSFAKITAVAMPINPMAVPTAILVFVIAERCSFGMGILTMVGSELRERGTLMMTLGSCLYDGGFCINVRFKISRMF